VRRRETEARGGQGHRAQAAHEDDRQRQGKRASAGTVKVRAKLTRVAKRRLGRLRRSRATLEVTVTDGGATQRFAEAVTIKR
jgi:hypothetical protein